MQYAPNQPLREITVSGRVTLADRRRIEAAALDAGTTLSTFVAKAATQAAVEQLIDRQEATA